MNSSIARFEDLEVWKKAHKPLEHLKDNKGLKDSFEEIGRMLHGLIKSIQ